MGNARLQEFFLGTLIIMYKQKDVRQRSPSRNIQKETPLNLSMSL